MSNDSYNKERERSQLYYCDGGCRERKIELPQECGELVLSIFKKYKAEEPLTPSTKDSIETVERWLKKVIPSED